VDTTLTFVCLYRGLGIEPTPRPNPWPWSRSRSDQSDKRFIMRERQYIKTMHAMNCELINLVTSTIWQCQNVGDKLFNTIIVLYYISECVHAIMMIYALIVQLFILYIIMCLLSNLFHALLSDWSRLILLVFHNILFILYFISIEC